MKVLLIFVAVFFFLIFSYSKAHAIEDPLSVANNKIGIHILFPEEIKEVTKLINSNGGDYGYVVIPIQSGDKDLVKWQKFMDTARQSHIIPIIRLASEGDYFNTKVWRTPNQYDIVDFANFLSSLSWPTKNRYIVVFNEPNRSDEWGGTSNPSQYAQILDYAIATFKARSEDFFVISAGLDNAAAQNPPHSYSDLDFLKEMNRAVSGIFNKIDGLGSHSYPNPGFSAPPSKQDKISIATFRYELDLTQNFGAKKLPVFITETGWSRSSLTDEHAAQYYKQSFESVWNDKSIVTVTPFLFKAGHPFDMFSFINPDGSETKQYKAIEQLSKIKGDPAQNVLGAKTQEETVPSKPLISLKIDSTKLLIPSISKTSVANIIFKWLMKI